MWLVDSPCTIGDVLFLPLSFVAALPTTCAVNLPRLATRGSYDFDDSGQISYSEYIRYALRDALVRSASRVIDLFRKWDEDGDGTVDKKEFRKALRQCGFDAPLDAMNELFEEMDSSGDGKVDFKEMNRVLRQGSAVHGRLGLGAMYDAAPKRGQSDSARIAAMSDPTERREAARKEWAERGRKRVASPRMRARPVYGDVEGM